MCCPGKWRTPPSTWCKRKCDSSNQTTFFHCSVVQFWCSGAHLLVLSAVYRGQVTLTSPRLCSPIHNKLRCTVYSDTSINIFSNLSKSSSSVGSDEMAYVHQWSLSAHDRVTSSPLFLPWTTFDRYWTLQTWNTPQELQFWRCSDPVVYPSQFGHCHTLSNPNTCPFPASNTSSLRTTCSFAA